MRLIVTTLFIVLLISRADAQSFSQVDSVVKKYPKAFWSPEKLAKQIITDFHSDSAKARAIYTWMAKHIAYDVKKFALMKRRKYVDRIKNQVTPFNLDIYQKKVAFKTLRSKKGVCGEYAILYDRLCKLTGIPAEIVNGFAKTTPEDIGKMPYGVNHAWNVVMINNRWRLLDVTWGAGGVDLSKLKFRFRFEPAYFLTDPDLFNLNHFPQRKKWLLTERTDSAFADLPLYHVLSKEIEIMSPSSGMIDNNSKYGIAFEVRAIDLYSVVYRYSKEDRRVSHRPAIVERNGTYQFNVDPPARTRDYLTVYFNGTAFATFKVKSKRFIKTPFAGTRLSLAKK